jgi:hypothetical protein
MVSRYGKSLSFHCPHYQEMRLLDDESDGIPNEDSIFNTIHAISDIIYSHPTSSLKSEMKEANGRIVSCATLLGMALPPTISSSMMNRHIQRQAYVQASATTRTVIPDSHYNPCIRQRIIGCWLMDSVALFNPVTRNLRL